MLPDGIRWLSMALALRSPGEWRNSGHLSWAASLPETDVPAKLMAFGDPVVQRFSWSRTAPYTEADAGAYFVEQEQARRRGEALHYAVVEPANDDVVLGGGSLYDVDLEQSRAAVGYWVAPDSRGRGVVTHAVRPLARWAFLRAGPGPARADMRSRQ